MTFPDRTHMKDFLPALEKYLALLPVARVKRWGMGIYNKESVKRSLENFNENVDAAKGQWDLLKQIGL